MAYSEIVNKIFKEAGDRYDDMECYIETSEDLEISVHDGEVANHTVASTEGLSFRGSKDSKMGYSYTEKIDESSIEFLIDEAEENARSIDSQDRELIYEGSKDYSEFKRETSDLEAVLIDKKIALLKEIEKKALDFSSSIKSVNYCIYNESINKTFIENTKGLKLEEDNILGQVYLSVVAEKSGDIQTGNASVISRKFEDFKVDDIVAEACRDAISMLGASSIESDSYNVIIYNKTFSSLLSAFLSVFIADNVQKDMSLMKGKLEEEVASKIFTLREEPHLSRGYNSRSFDDEGTATYSKDIIGEGVLKNYAYNWKTALKEGVDSTGNGFRNSYKGGNTTSFTNLVVSPGRKSFNELLKTLDNGIFITDLQGLHSGLNAVSGDFSLSANGYEIKEGKIYRPVNQITIAGNLVDLLKNIEELGSDAKMSGNAIESPSILIKDVMVSGE